MGLENGQVISHFEIVGLLGTGAMGEVYRARDTTLDRDVALKVISADRVGDPAEVRRLEREAKALASLNHPNIAHIHGFEKEGETNFLVLELVEGHDLAERISRGPLPWSEARDLCRQIAEGLEAAHEMGVVHRDLKPANVRVTADGVAKMLDFGLAISHRSSAGSGDSTVQIPLGTTRDADGLLVGTPSYMSPEQVRGQPVDKRSDIWAFGCLMVECLTGEKPFEGGSVADTLVSIVEREPDLEKLPKSTPPPIRRLIARCLQKDARLRLRDIGEARIVLGESLPLQAEAPPEPSERRGLPPGVWITMTVAVALIVGLVVREFAPPPPLISPFAVATPIYITDTEATEFDATISRDGDWLAFVSDMDGAFDIWSGPTQGTSFQNLTKGGKRMYALKVRDIGFDLEGNHIWITGEKRHDSIYKIPVNVVQEPTPFMSGGVVNVDWSPNDKGRRLVYHTDYEGDPMFVDDGDGSPPREIIGTEPGLHQHYPTWSFDGDWIFFSRGWPSTRQMDLWRIRPDGSDAEQLTHDLLDVGYPTPIDRNTLLFLAFAPDGSGPWIWMLDLRTDAPPRRAAMGAERYTSLSASEDGRTLVATKANPRANIFSVPIPGPGEMAREPDVSPEEQLEKVRALAPRFAGDDLYFLSSRGTGDGVWRRRDGKLKEIMSGRTAPLLAPPATHFGPEGTRLALVLRAQGRLRLHVLDPDGGRPRPLAENVQVRGAPTWAPDGTSIAIGGSDATGDGLFRFPVNGDPATLIVRGKAVHPAWSPTDDLIVFAGTQIMAYHPLLAVRPSTLEMVRLPDIQVTRLGERYAFLPDGSGLIYMQGNRPSQDFWLLDLTDLSDPSRMGMRQLTDLSDTAAMATFDVDPSGTRIVFDRTRQNSNVVLIELPERDDE